MKNLWLKQDDKNKRISPQENINPLLHATSQDTDSKMDLAIVKKMLNQMGETCRQVLLMFYYDGFDMQTIAKANNFSNADVAKSKKHQCLKELEKQVKKLYEDSEWMVLTPLSFEASKVYGMGTKWCTTQERHWNDYISNYKLIYIINKLNNDKFAVSRDKRSDSKIQAWLSDDKETSPFMIPLPSNIMSIITEEVRKKECVTDLINESNPVKVRENSLDIMRYFSKYITSDYNSPYGEYLTYGENGDISGRELDEMLTAIRTYYK